MHESYLGLLKEWIEYINVGDKWDQVDINRVHELIADVEVLSEEVEFYETKTEN